MALGLVNLEELYINDTQVRDISVLRGLTNLRILTLYGTQVSDKQAAELSDALTELRIKR